MLTRFCLSPRISIAAIAILLCLLGTAATSSASQPAAVIMAVDGEVMILHVNGEQEPAGFGSDLEAGDEVRTGADSAADLVFASGQSIHLGAGSQITIQGEKRADESDSSGSGGGNFKSAKRFMQLRESRGTSSVASLRSSGGSAVLRAQAPCQSAVLSPLPTFQWAAPDDTGELELSVYNDDGKQWSTRILGSSSVQYPAEAPTLEPGVHYSWTLESSDPLQFPPLRAPASYFEVLAEGDATRVADSLSEIDAAGLSDRARILLRASVYYENGLLALAIQETQQALGEHGGGLQTILANLYIESGRTEEALSVYDELLDPQR